MNFIELTGSVFNGHSIGYNLVRVPGAVSWPDGVKGP